MGRKGKRKGRSSGSDSEGHTNKEKQFKHGGSNDSGDDGLCLSQVLGETNAVLYEVNELSNPASARNDSVFLSNPSPETVDRVNETMADVISNGRGPTNKPAKVSEVKGPSIKDVLMYLQKMDVKLVQMDKKLEGIEALERKVDKLEVEMNKLWTYVHEKDKRYDERIANAEEKCECLDFSSSQMSDRIMQLERERDSFKEDLTYVQSQSMRNNLLFSNIPEEKDETPEQTEKTLREFIQEKMKVAEELAKALVFERVHRIGRKNGERPRQIVAKFNLYKEREYIRKRWKQLESTPYNVYEQVPREVVEKRRKLLPKLKEAKDRGRKAWFTYDTLYIDGKPVRPTSD